MDVHSPSAPGAKTTLRFVLGEVMAFSVRSVIRASGDVSGEWRAVS